MSYDSPARRGPWRLAPSYYPSNLPWVFAGKPRFEHGHWFSFTTGLVETGSFTSNVPFGAVTEEHFDKLFNINVRGTRFTVQKALPLLNDGGSIILNGSVASVNLNPA